MLNVIKTQSLLFIPLSLPSPVTVSLLRSDQPTVLIVTEAPISQQVNSSLSLSLSLSLFITSVFNFSMIEKLPEISRRQIYVCVSEYEIFIFNFFFNCLEMCSSWPCTINVHWMFTSTLLCLDFEKIAIKNLIFFKKAVGLKVFFFGVG